MTTAGKALWAKTRMAWLMVMVWPSDFDVLTLLDSLSRMNSEMHTSFPLLSSLYIAESLCYFDDCDRRSPVSALFLSWLGSCARLEITTDRYYVVCARIRVVVVIAVLLLLLF